MTDPERLQALREADLLDTLPEESFELPSEKTPRIGHSVVERRSAQAAARFSSVSSIRWNSRIFWRTCRIFSRVFGLTPAVVRNVTERKEAEAREHQLFRETLAREQAEEAQERIRAILESITDAFFALDEKWCFTYVNAEAEALLDRSREELLGKNIWELYPASAQRAFYPQYHRAVQEKVAVEFEEYSPGPDRWLRVRLYPYKEGLTVYLSDVTERKRMKQALHRSEERFRNIVENMGEAIIITDLEERVLYANQRVEEIFGYRPDELYGKIASEVLMSPEERAAQKKRQKRRTQGIAERYEVHHWRKDGTRIWVEIDGAPFRNTDDEITGTVGVVRDITTRKQAEEALRESERQHRLLFEGNPLPMWAFDPETLRFLGVNEAAVLHYGYSREEFLSMTIRDIRAKEDLPELEQVLRGGLDDGHTDIVRHRTKDGREIRALVTGSTRGLGRTIAAWLVREGAQVVVSGREEAAVRAATDELRALGGEVLGIAADLARPDEAHRL
ncbi:MAG: SDR family NAD(P)-dependent oxidoreductase, partial [Gemmatimonadetes bacterium]|nr:SDR family NAD(P)-dependent oxidoreductase [Gemmatimonadota bacterium]